MNIIQCRMCRKPFDSIGGKICHECLQKIDKDFVKVRDYIYEHKRTDVDTVSEETEVDKAVILYLIKEGRIELGGGSGGGVLVCEVCRKPISSGRMCPQCMDKLSSTMQKSIGIEKSAGGDKAKRSATDPKSTKGMHTRPFDK